jgi:hypothetical protein
MVGESDQLESRPSVVIAGGGIAAAASAMALLSSGIKPVLLCCARPSMRMVEAIPGIAGPLLAALGILPRVAAISQIGPGVDNLWQSEQPVRLSTPLLQVDRTTLASTMLTEAVTRGASIHTCRYLPRVRRHAHGVLVAIDGQRFEFDAAIDATGRSAIWMGPCVRVRHAVATIFTAPPMHPSQPLKIQKFSDGWAYRVGTPAYTTIGVLASQNVRYKILPESIRGLMWPSDSRISLVGRRVAFVQWSPESVTDRVVAVGDAALAHDPVSGQGIRFAIASALAATAMIRTWLSAPADSQSASDFYREFVATERTRHLSFLRHLYGQEFGLQAGLENLPPSGSDEAKQSMSVSTGGELPRRLCFSAKVEPAALHIDGIIKRGEIIRLRDGGAVRWLGGFDLLKLRHLTGGTIRVARLIELLADEKLTRSQAEHLIGWCLSNNILASTTS